MNTAKQNSWLEQMDTPVIQIGALSSKTPVRGHAAATAPSLTELRRWNRCYKSWPKFKPSFEQSIGLLNSLGLLQREAACSHFLGGCSAELQTNGSISRKQFLRLMLAAYEFGKAIK